MGRGDLTVYQVTYFVLKLQYVFRKVVISETMMSTDHKTQKESYTRRSAYVLFFYFLLSKCQLRSSCIRLLHLHETRNVHENLSLSLCVCVCVCAYVYKGCCNINDTEAGRLGREITAVEKLRRKVTPKSFDLSRSTTKPTK